MKQIIVIVLLLIVLFAFASLITAAPYLLWLLPGGLPVGNALTATGLCSAAIVAFLLSNPKTILRWAAIVAIVLSLLWLPISIGLAGNLSLNFEGADGLVWSRYTFVTLVFVLMALLWAIAQGFKERSFKRRP